MRLGLSWDLDRFDCARTGWDAVLSEAEAADRMGFQSFWIREGRAAAAHCSAPAIFLTHLAQKVKNAQLRIAGRRVTRALPAHVAEEVAVLDTFARGRGGLAFAAASVQGVPARHVHEMIEFVAAAWSLDEMRYRGDHIRFPAHTPDDAPRGVSTPQTEGPYLPQWEWGEDTPDFLSITPKPSASHVPLNVEIDDDETLEWAARSGISPMVGADLPTAEAVERLARYRSLADAAGRARHEVEVVLERRIALDGAGDERTLAGSPRDVLNAIRSLRAETAISHFVWRRSGATPMDLHRFASEIQVLLQA